MEKETPHIMLGRNWKITFHILLLDSVYVKFGSTSRQFKIHMHVYLCDISLLPA